MEKRIYISIFYLLIIFSVSSFAQTYIVSGTITTTGGSPIGDVTVSLNTFDGQLFSQTTTDSNGYYALPGVNFSSIVPSKDNYYFNPMQEWLSMLYSNQTVNFTGTEVSAYYTISGTIKYSDGVPFDGLGIGVNAVANNYPLFNKTMTTDDNGFYTFSDLPDGITYIVAPFTTPGYSFEPGNMIFNDLNSDKIDVDFIANLLPFFSISGTIKDTDGAPISGIPVDLRSPPTGFSMQSITDSNGYYIFSDLLGGTAYSLAIPRNATNYSFQPFFIDFPNLISDQIADFTGTKLQGYSISGTIKDTSGTPISDVIVDLINLNSNLTTQATTDNNGYYIFSDLAVQGNYRVTPSKDNYYFDPYDRDFIRLNSDQISDFICIEGPPPDFFNISGTITDTSGAPLSDVTVELNRYDMVVFTTTDNNGYYIFSDLPKGYNYRVTPSYSKRYFDPPNISFFDLNSNRTADFIAKQGFDISGVIKDVYGTPISGVTITCTGAGVGEQTTTTDTDGYYIFSNIRDDANGSVIPYHPHYDFQPPNRPFEFYFFPSDLTANFVAYSTTSVDNSTELPTSYSLAQNYPNPFNPSTKIKYAIKESGFVTIKLFDIFGREVTKLVNTYQSSGSYEISFDGTNLTSGVYYYNININDFSATKKMLILK